MDRSVAQRIIARETGPLMALLGIGHWRIVTTMDLADDHTLGQCETLIDYNRATIAFNPALFSDEKSLLKTIRHELFHVVLSPFDLFMETINQIEALEPLRPALTRLWTHAQEMGVVNLERMFHGLTTPPEPPKRSRAK